MLAQEKICSADKTLARISAVFKPDKMSEIQANHISEWCQKGKTLVCLSSNHPSSSVEVTTFLDSEAAEYDL